MTGMGAAIDEIRLNSARKAKDLNQQERSSFYRRRDFLDLMTDKRTKRKEKGKRNEKEGMERKKE